MINCRSPETSQRDPEGRDRLLDVEKTVDKGKKNQEKVCKETGKSTAIPILVPIVVARVKGSSTTTSPITDGALSRATSQAGLKT
jgi:hypothetical protein